MSVRMLWWMLWWMSWPMSWQLHFSKICLILLTIRDYMYISFISGFIRLDLIQLLNVWISLMIWYFHLFSCDVDYNTNNAARNLMKPSNLQTSSGLFRHRYYVDKTNVRGLLRLPESNTRLNSIVNHCYYSVFTQNINIANFSVPNPHDCRYM